MGLYVLDLFLYGGLASKGMGRGTEKAADFWFD
jgi:hypothetical protein